VGFAEPVKSIYLIFCHELEQERQEDRNQRRRNDELFHRLQSFISWRVQTKFSVNEVDRFVAED
jgi:hypothetical protein